MRFCKGQKHNPVNSGSVGCIFHQVPKKQEEQVCRERRLRGPCGEWREA